MGQRRRIGEEELLSTILTSRVIINERKGTIRIELDIISITTLRNNTKELQYGGVSFAAYTATFPLPKRATSVDSRSMEMTGRGQASIEISIFHIFHGGFGAEKFFNHQSDPNLFSNLVYDRVGGKSHGHRIYQVLITRSAVCNKMQTVYRFRKRCLADTRCVRPFPRAYMPSPPPSTPAPGKYTCLHAFELFIGVSPISLSLSLSFCEIYIYIYTHLFHNSSGEFFIGANKFGENPATETVPCPAENLANLTLAAWPTRDKEANRRGEERERERESKCKCPEAQPRSGEARHRPPL